jgi:hypothetical protein
MVFSSEQTCGMENLLRGDSDDRLGKKLKTGWKAGGGNQVANNH